jgi:hypothetical protein
MRLSTTARLALAVPLLCLPAVSACKSKTYTCGLYTTFGGQKILVKTVEVKSQKECADLAG